MLQKTRKLTSRIPWLGESGQALVEFSLVALMLIMLTFGLIDFCRAIYIRQVIVNLAREGANLASRGTGDTRGEIMTNAMNAVVASASPLSITTNGIVIITAVTNRTSSAFFINQQMRKGGEAANPPIIAASRIGTGVNQPATMPTVNPALAQTGYTVYVAEIYYRFTPITPIGRLIRVVLPSQMYDVAYFTSF